MVHRHACRALHASVLALLRRKVGSRGVDVYFDNVGGFILNETLRRLNQRARVVVCGAISSYNATDERGALGSGLSNHMALITQVTNARRTYASKHTRIAPPRNSRQPTSSFVYVPAFSWLSFVQVRFDSYQLNNTLYV